MKNGKPTYSTSTGERVTTSQIEYRLTKSKDRILEGQRNEHGYNFCQRCDKNSNHAILDVSHHNVSKKHAKESGQAELCWEIDNLEILCRKCHEEKDKLNLQYANDNRDQG